MKDAGDKVLWTVSGPNWSYSIRDSRRRNPLEIATVALESICEESKRSDFLRDFCGEDALTVGMLLSVQNSGMTGREDDLMVPTTIVLANAGFFQEASELEAAWAKLSETDQVSHLLKSLG